MCTFVLTCRKWHLQMRVQSFSLENGEDVHFLVKGAAITGLLNHLLNDSRKDVHICIDL